MPKLSKPPKPPGWTPAVTVEEALARYRDRLANQISFDVVCEDVGERVAIKYADADEIPEYRIMEHECFARVFRRTGDGWLSAYVHDAAEVQRIVEWLEKEAQA